MAGDVKVIGRGSDHQDPGIDHLLHNLTPVIILDDAPVLLLAFLATKAGIDFLPCKGDELGLYTPLFAGVKNCFDEDSVFPSFRMLPEMPSTVIFVFLGLGYIECCDGYMKACTRKC